MVLNDFHKFNKIKLNQEKTKPKIKLNSRKLYHEISTFDVRVKLLKD